MHRRGAGWRPAVNAKRIFRPQFIPPSDSLVFATFHTTCLPSLYPLPLTKEGQAKWSSGACLWTVLSMNSMLDT